MPLSKRILPHGKKALSKFITSSSAIGVSKLVAGANITLSPTVGTGSVTITAGAGGGGGTVDPSTQYNVPYFINTTTVSGSDNFTFDGDHLKLLDSKKAIFGTGDDLQIYHNGSNSYLDNNTGDFRIQNYASDKDIIFKIKDNITETEVMRIDGSVSRVGIGTTLPDYKLHVVGDILATSNINVGAGAGYTLESYSNNQRYGLKYGAAGTVDDSDILMLTNREGDGDIQIATSSGNTGGAGEETTRMTVKHTTGYVGIGTDAPDKPFVIRTGGTRDFKFYDYDMTYESSLGIRAKNGGYLGLVTEGANDVFISTNGFGNKRLVVKSDGLVGIGTTAPASYSDKFTVKMGSGVNGWPIAFTNSDDSIKGALRTDFGDNYIALATKTETDIRFFYDDSEANTALMIVGSGATAGNVGIGTTTPGAKLDIQESTAGTALVSRIWQTEGVNVGSSAEFRIIGGNASTASLKLSDNVAHRYSLVADTSDNLSFKAQDTTTRMTLTSAGRLGIGTTSPGYELDVFGNINIKSGGYFRWGSGDAQIIEAAQASLGFQLYDGSSAFETALYLKGNSTTPSVGIGTTTPEALLDVDAGTSSNYTIRSQNQYGMIKMSHNSGGWNVIEGRTAGNTDYQDLVFKTAGGTGQMVIDTDGLVGIGTTSPGAALDVAYGGAAAALRVYNSQATNPYGFLVDNTATSTLNDNYVADFRVGGVSMFSVRNSGKVGIGTTAPVKWLEVIGDNSLWPIILASGSSDHGTGIQLYNGASGGGSDLMKWSFVAGGSSNSAGPDDSLKFYNETESRYKMLITSGGNVGIGTFNSTYPFTPAGMLHVRASGAASQIILESRSATENYSTGVSLSYGTARAIRFNKHGSNATYGGYSWEIGSADVGGTEIMRLSSEGNLGIGTTAPTQKLDVRGTAQIIGDIAVSGVAFAGDTGYGNSFYQYNQTGTQTLRMYSDSRNVSGGKRQFIQASARLDINSSEHLGLGTTSSGEYLHLYTAATSNMYIDAGGSFLFRDVDDSSAVRMKLYSATGKLLLNDSSADTKIQLQPSGDSYITNNVGIGTTAPAEKLTIGGTGKFLLDYNDTGPKSSTEMFHIVTSGTEAAFAIEAQSAGSGIKNMALLPNLSQDIKNLGQYWDSGGGGNYTDIYEWGWDGDATPANRKFQFKMTDEYPIHFIQDNNDRLVIASGGNVGIGTTAPNVKLDVVGDARIRGSNKLYFGDTDTTEYISTAGTDDLRIHASDTVLIDGDGKSMFRTPYLALETSAASEKFRFDIDNGKFGIGTNAPEALLHVEGTDDLPIAIYSGSGDTTYHYKTSSGGDISFQYHVAQGRSADIALISNADSGEKTTIRQKVIDANNSYMLFRTRDAGALTNTMILSGSKVGIGITSPAEPLHVVGDVAFSAVGSTYSGDRIVGAIGGLQFIANGGNAMKLTGTGLGIGTTAPTQKLDIVGNTKIRGTADGEVNLYLGQFSDSATTAMYEVSTFDAGGGLLSLGDHLETKSNRWTLYESHVRGGQGGEVPVSRLASAGSDTSFQLYRATNPTTDATYTTAIKLNVNGDSYFNGGNVGIGTTAPTSMLHLSSSTASEPVITIENTNADNTPPGLTFFKNTASPASGDQIGSIKFNSKEATSGDTKTYWEIQPRINDATNTSPNGQLNFYGLDGDSPGFIHQFQFINSQFSVLNSDGVGPTLAITGTNGGLLKSAGTKFRLQAGSASNGEFLVMCDYFGINTTSPSKQLHVEGDSYLNGSLIVEDFLQCDKDGTPGILVGEGGDADIYYDGTNMIFNAARVGAGKESHITTVHASGASFQKSLGEVLYLRNALNIIEINAILQHAPNIQYVKPEPTSVAGGSVIPTELPLADADNIGLEITVVQDWSADPTAALSVQKQTGSSDVIYEGASNTASTTVSIAAYRGANKTFVIAAAGVWVVKD